MTPTMTPKLACAASSAGITPGRRMITRSGTAVSGGGSPVWSRSAIRRGSGRTISTSASATSMNAEPASHSGASESPSSSLPARSGANTAGPRIPPNTAPKSTSAIPCARRSGGYMSPAAVRASSAVPAAMPIRTNAAKTSTADSAADPTAATTPPTAPTPKPAASTGTRPTRSIARPAKGAVRAPQASTIAGPSPSSPELAARAAERSAVLRAIGRSGADRPTSVARLGGRRDQLEPDACPVFVLYAPALGHRLDQHEAPASDLVERHVARSVLEAHAGVRDLHADAASVQCAQLELDDLVLGGAAVANGVVHELAGEQQQRALELGGQPRGGALDPRARALGCAAASGDRDAKPLPRRVERRLEVECLGGGVSHGGRRPGTGSARVEVHFPRRRAPARALALQGQT